jgi:hypothetical protein
LKITAGVAEELNQSNQNNEKKEGIQHTKARLGVQLNNKLESKVMHGQNIRSIDTLQVKTTNYHGC